MNMVYIISYKETYSDGSFSSGISYAFWSMQDALKMLNSIKEDEKQYYLENGTRETIEEVEDLITDYTECPGFIIDFGDEYTEYIIQKFEVK